MTLKKIFLISVALLLIFSVNVFAFAVESTMLAMPYGLCLDANNFEKGFQKPYTEENVRTCLLTAYPYTISECESIPTNLVSEFQETCFLKVHACENISSPQIKQQCEAEKANIAARNATNFVWNGACGVIPLIMLALIVLGGIQLFRKKITKKKALVLVLMLILLFAILGFLMFNAPCNVCGTICMY